MNSLVHTLTHLLCHLLCIAAHRDVGPSVRLSGSHTFLVVTHSYVSQATHVLIGMLPLCILIPTVMCFTQMTVTLSSSMLLKGDNNLNKFVGTDYLFFPHALTDYNIFRHTKDRIFIFSMTDIYQVI